MTPELIGILSVGAALFVGLGGLILSVTARFNARIDRLEDRFVALEARMDARFESLETRIDTLSERVARVEGVIEGLFAGMNGRRAAGDKEAAA
ncbi:MAG: hypothetical protein OXG43_00520 [Chloroflexi bacterium]|nr:hypothetical protein [Chloroflexota bacterium]